MAVDYAALKEGGFMRQKQKDMFSMRLRVVGGTVTTEQLSAIAAVAKKYGQDYVHLTSRQGVEIPFIRLKDIETVKAELAQGGVQCGSSGPRVRTVTACQGGRCCPSGCIDARDIAVKLDERYFGRRLPHKFKFGVTGCQNNCLKAEENDVGVKGCMAVSWNADACVFCGKCVKSCRAGALSMGDGQLLRDETRCTHCGRCVKSCPTGAWEGKSGFLLSFGGTFGNRIRPGMELLPMIEDEAALFRVTDAAIEFFSEFAEPGERFSRTIDRVGAERLLERLEAACQG